MIQLPTVTMVIVDTISYGKAITAIRKSLEQITPARTIFFTDLEMHDDFEIIKIKTIRSKDEYSHFIAKELYKYIETEHILVIQADGYVLDGKAWMPEFLQYDYIGAPWQYLDGRNVGNGGFSLRSKKLMKAVATDDFVSLICPEDEAIARTYRAHLETFYKIKFAPDGLAHKFAFELNEPAQSTFGFHGSFHLPYRQQVVIKRAGAMGDIIMMEPVMEWFNNNGYQVIVDIPLRTYNFFARHYYPVYHIKQFKSLQPDVKLVDLDMAYEVTPKQLALKSYFEMAGIKNYKLRNSKLLYGTSKTDKMFDKYIVLHTDDTAMEHRNVHNVDWEVIAFELESMGYTVLNVNRTGKKGGIKFNPASESMLIYILGGADLFIGIDSGPAQIAMACETKSAIFFGSVNAKYRYADLSNALVIQNPCPIQNDGCYHSVVSVVGTECVVDAVKPPCITHNMADVMVKIKNFLMS